MSLNEFRAVGDLLATAMASNEITQVQIAETLGKDQATVSRYVNGKSLPRREDWQKLETFLQLPEHAIAFAAGHAVVIDGNTEGLPPMILQAARDLSELDAADLKRVLDLARRLSGK